MSRMLQNATETVFDPIRRTAAKVPETVVEPAKRAIDTISTTARTLGERVRDEPLRTVLPYVVAAVAIGLAIAATGSIMRRIR